MVDMSGAAIAGRLRELARLRALGATPPPRIDMSATGLTARLRVLGALSDMCRRLGAVGATLVSAEGGAIRAPTAPRE